ncbi:MAG: PEGA domain-containing protein [Verrucomicrobiota bacterium]
MVFLGWDYHRRHLRETTVTAEVFVEGNAVGPRYDLREGGVLLTLWRPKGILWREIEVSAKDAEPLTTNLFVWYGENSLGRVDLERGRGKIELQVSPRPARYSLKSGVVEYSTPTGFFSNIPAGEYEAVFKYTDKIVARLPVRVVSNERRTVAVTNDVGCIELVVKGETGEFLLEGLGGEGRWTGTLPFSVPYVRPGEFRLLAHRREYGIDRRLKVEPGKTNRVEIEFAYGSLDISTKPEGASIFISGKSFGESPKVFDGLIPGSYTFELRKEGFDSVRVEAPVLGNETNRVVRELVNTRYREAMERFQGAKLAGRYVEAEDALKDALSAVPEDPVARKEEPQIRLDALRDRAKRSMRDGAFTEAEEYLKRLDQMEPGNGSNKSLWEELQQLREEGAKAKERAEIRRKQELEEDRLRKTERALDLARVATASGDLAQARARLAEAKGLSADHPQIKGVEDAIAEAQRKSEAENARLQLEDQVKNRRIEFRSAMETSVREEKHSPVATMRWRTGKSARQVEFACEPKEGKGMDVYEQSSPRDYLITWRNGRPLPILGTGVYLRFGAVTLSPGETEVVCMLYSLVLGNDGRVEADGDRERNAARVRTVNETLKKALGGDLEPLSQ